MKTKAKDKNLKSGFKRIIVMLGIIILIYSIISLVITKFVYDSQFPRYNRHDETVMAGLRYQDLEDKFPRQLFKFNSGKNELQGYLYGQMNDRGLVVVAHGIGGGADSYLPQITWFVEQGWRVLAFDATGSFDSEGRTTRGFPQSLLDLDALLLYVDDQPELADLPLLLFGHSWGGYAAANILHYDHDILGVVSVSGANSPMEMVIEQGRQMMGGFIYLQSPYLWLYQYMLFGQSASLSADDAIRENHTPVMLIHGSDDEMVQYDGSAIAANFQKDLPEHVQVLIRDQAGRNGHNDLFRSEDSIAYINEINVTYRKLYDQYEQNIPYDVKQEFYATVDRELAQQLDPYLMQEINSFYLGCLP